MPATAPVAPRRILLLILLLTALFVGLQAGGSAPSASAQVPPPVCGPGEKPSTDMCTPRKCAPGEDPVVWECIPVPWPEPVSATRDCVAYYAYLTTTKCADVAFHGPVAGQTIYARTPTRDERGRVVCIAVGVCEWLGPVLP